MPHKKFSHHSIIIRSILSMMLRASALASRFLLVIYIARFLGVDALGVYGLASATLVIAIILAGFHFTSFSVRELLKQTELSVRAQMIRDQLVFHFVSYIFLSPLVLFLFITGILPWEIALWVFCLMVTEHLAQEGYRLLIYLGFPVQANLLFFIRTGAWVFLIVGIGWLIPGLRSLDIVFMGWLIGSATSVILTVWVLRAYPWNQVIHKKVDWCWIKHGLHISVPFFLSALTVILISYSDRYFIEIWLGTDMVGIYTFFISVALSIQNIVNSGVSMPLSAKVIKAYQRNERADYEKAVRTLFLATPLITVVFLIIAVVAIYPLMWVVEEQIDSAYLSVYWVLLGAVLINCIADPLYYLLYARNMDRQILIASVFGMVFFFGVLVSVINPLELMGVALAYTAGWAALLIGRGFLFLITR